MHIATQSMGSPMAHDEEPILTSPPTHEVARHVEDYSRFTALLKWGAIVCLIIAVIAVMFIKAYW